MTPGGEPVIACEGLTRWYGHVVGLVDVGCDIAPGITGLLGPNGAGKTTFIRLVTGQLRPSAGTLRVFGEAPFANTAVLARLGFCPDEDALYDQLTGHTMVTRLLQLHGFPGAEARQRAEAALTEIGLADAMHRSVRGYSKGMRQRVKIAQALAHRPELLVLDEPLTGTDPVVRADLKRAIQGFAEGGGTVLVSSHVLHEVEELTSRVIVLYGNRLLADGEVGELRALMEDIPHRVRVRCDRPRDLARAIFDAVPVSQIAVDDGSLEAHTRDPAGLYAALAGVIAATGALVHEIVAEDVDLSSVFRYLTE